MSNLINSTLLACAQTGAISTAMGAGASETAFYFLQAAFYTPMNRVTSLAVSNIHSPPATDESIRSALKRVLGAKKITSQEELKTALKIIGVGTACALPATLLTYNVHEKLGYDGNEVENSLGYHVGIAAVWSGGMTLISHLLGCLLEENQEINHGS